MNNSDFVTIAATDESRHAVAHDATYTAIETNLYGFNIPEAGIDSMLYLVLHPVLGVASMAVFVWKGFKQQQLAADYYNEHVFLPMVADNTDYVLQLGSCSFRASVLEPLRTIAISIDDARRNFRLDLTMSAVIPPVGRPGGHHFTQLMHNRGELLLEGQRYPIDSLYIRDRSFSQGRAESIQAGPPANWMTGCFGRDLAFHLSILDSSVFPTDEYGAQWHRHIDPSSVRMQFESGGKTPTLSLRGGWWYAGEFPPRRLTDVRFQTRLGPDGLTPLGIDLELTDATGEVHAMRGETISLLPKMQGQNSVVYSCFTKWTYAGRAGYGDMLIVYNNDHLSRR